MFFLLSKLLDVLLSPLTWALLLIALGVRPRGARWSRSGPVTGLVVLCVFSSEPVANGLVRQVEKSAPRTVKEGATYDAVILLGGFVDGGASERYGAPEYNDNVERLLTTFDLLRTGRAKSAILSGGSIGADVVEARTMADQLTSWGIDRSRLVLEETSRNTRENAVESARLARERGFASLLLVTSAYHMERALGCFRAVGLAVDTLPVDYRAFDPDRYATSWLPRAGFLAESTMAIREISGRAIYRARGYTK